MGNENNHGVFRRLFKGLQQAVCHRGIHVLGLIDNDGLFFPLKGLVHYFLLQAANLLNTQTFFIRQRVNQHHIGMYQLFCFSALQALPAEIIR